MGTEARRAVVIGSGFGGAVAALRLGEKGVKTLVLERGRAWAIPPNQDTSCTYRKPDGRAACLGNETVLFEPKPIDRCGKHGRQQAADGGEAQPGWQLSGSGGPQVGHTAVPSSTRYISTRRNPGQGGTATRASRSRQGENRS